MKKANCGPIFFLFTCVKNGRPFILKLFDSLLRQTTFNFVHFIYDDGSDDPIEDLVYDYKKKASFPVMYEKNDCNIGLNLSTRHCIQKCNLPFFIWIDCDNWVDSHFFEELENTYRKHKNASVIRSLRLSIKDDCVYNQINGFDNYINSIKAKRDYDSYLLFEKYYFSFFAVSFSDYKKVNNSFFILNKRSLFNDQQVLFALSKLKKRFYFNKKAIGYCAIRSDSESSVNYFENANDRIGCFCELNSILHINNINYEDIKNCLRLQKQHQTLFERQDYVGARVLLSKKRKIFSKNHIRNRVLPFCDKSLFSIIYFLSPRLSSFFYRIIKR